MPARASAAVAPNNSLTAWSSAGSSRPARSLASGKSPTAITIPPARKNSRTLSSVDQRMARIAGSTNTRYDASETCKRPSRIRARTNDSSST